MILVLIPLGGLVLGLLLWIGLRGLGALSLGAERPERISFRDRRASGERFSFRPGSAGLRDWAESVPQGCLIAVIVATAVWVLAWLVFLIFGLNLLS